MISRRPLATAIFAWFLAPFGQELRSQAVGIIVDPSVKRSSAIDYLFTRTHEQMWRNQQLRTHMLTRMQNTAGEMPLDPATVADPPVAERFTTSSDVSTIADTRAGLRLQVQDDGRERTWKEAEEHCRTLRFGGYSDRRLSSCDAKNNPAVAKWLRQPLRATDDPVAFYWSVNTSIGIPFNYSGKSVLHPLQVRSHDSVSSMRVGPVKMAWQAPTNPPSSQRQSSVRSRRKLLGALLMAGGVALGVGGWYGAENIRNDRLAKIDRSITEPCSIPGQPATPCPDLSPLFEEDLKEEMLRYGSLVGGPALFGAGLLLVLK